MNQDQPKQIPMFNQDFDPGLFFHVAKSNLKWIIIIFSLVFITLFLYLRYTIPLYESSTIIQLTDENQEYQLLEKSEFLNSNIAQELELLRSPVFIQRTLDSLPLEITYFNKGRVIDFDSYDNAPYQIQLQNIQPQLYGIPIYIQFESDQLFQIKYKLINKTYKYNFKVNDKCKTPHLQFSLTLNSAKEIISESIGYYFVINDPSLHLSKFNAKIEISILNEAARTIKINTTDVNYYRASDLANGIAKEFENFNLEKKKESVNRMLEYIDNTLENIKVKLKESDSTLNEYKLKNKVIEETLVDPVAERNISLLQNFETRKLELEVQLMAFDDLEKKIGEKDFNIHHLLLLISQSGNQGYIGTIITNINNLFIKLDQVKQTSTENSKEYKRVTDQIEVQKKLLTENLSYHKQLINQKIKDLNSKIQSLEASLYSNQGAPGYQADYVQLKRAFEVNQKYYDELISKRAEFVLAREGYTPGYRILQVGKVNQDPVKPKKGFIIGLGLFIAVVFSLGLIVIKYVMHDLILSINDITRFTHIPVLGVVSKYNEEIPISQLVVHRNPKSITAEMFRNIRSNLDFISSDSGSKLISLTSTISGEGKTFISINLAGILAYTGKKVIILDADMRKPKIHLGFNAVNDKGLSTLLIEKDLLSDCIHKSSMENLHFITSGPIPPNPSELLISNKMQDLINELKTMYDYIVIDNPPVGIVSDGLDNIRQADYPIYVFRANYSRKFFINNIEKIKRENKLERLSLVLNGFELPSSSKYGGYGYGYGYGGYGYGMGYGYLDNSSGYYDSGTNVAKKNKNFFIRLFRRS
jgi:tyrosine-protein kinase Etk/Wzc